MRLPLEGLLAAAASLGLAGVVITTYLADLATPSGRPHARALSAAVLGSVGAVSLVTVAVWVVAAVFVVMAAIPGWRVVFESVVRRAAPRERLLIVGTNAAAVGLATELTELRYSLGLEIVGFVTVGTPATHGTIRVLGDSDDLPAIVQQHRVDRVVVSLADARGRLQMGLLLDMKMRGVRIDDLASVYERYTGKISIEDLRPSWLIFSSGFRATPRLLALKRLLDIVSALVALIVASPLMLLVALAVRLSSPGPVLYHQQRVCEGGRVFTLHKFRSMHVDAEAEA